MKAILSELHNMSLLSAELPVTFVPFILLGALSGVPFPSTPERRSSGRSSLNEAEQQSVTIIAHTHITEFKPRYTRLTPSYLVFEGQSSEELVDLKCPGCKGLPGLVALSEPDYLSFGNSSSEAHALHYPGTRLRLRRRS